VLFADAPVVDFSCDRQTCTCGGPLKVQKTQTKKVVSLQGTFICRQHVLYCQACRRTFDAPDLRRLVAHRCNTAWDVLVFIGRQLFENCCTIGQVHSQLLSCDVRLSHSQIAKLGRKFILYLAMAHRRATPKIKHAMALCGGYILHLDAVHQDDAPALMSGIDGLSRLVLANVKVPSEHADQIIPFLKQIKSSYGNPLACVHDMGTGICKAVTAVFAGTRDFICHFHFLRDVGKDLLEPSYRQLRGCLRQYAVSTQLNALARQTRQYLLERTEAASVLATAIAGGKPAGDPSMLTIVAAYALVLWCLQAKHSGDGYGFPFDRPLLNFARRLLTLIDALPRLLQTLPGLNRSGNRAFYHLSRKVLDVAADPAFEQAVEDLGWRCDLFDQLRSHMRIAAVGASNGLNDQGCQTAMTSIRDAVVRFRHKLESDPKLSADLLCRKMAAQIDKYADKLFADPIIVQTPSGPVSIYPQRTNNIMEQFFRSMHRKYRRRTGDNSMHRELQTMLADTPLVKNLSNPDYMKILLDGRSSLEELFAQLDAYATKQELSAPDQTDRILPGFRALTRISNLPDLIAQRASMVPDKVKSN